LAREKEENERLSTARSNVFFNNTKTTNMKQILIKIAVWVLSKLETEIEKCIREKGLPEVIYCHPSVFADCKKVEARFPRQGIRIIESELMEKGKFIFSWNEPFDINKSIRFKSTFGWPPISHNNPIANIINLGTP
jgi:hypothetical protein